MDNPRRKYFLLFLTLHMIFTLSFLNGCASPSAPPVQKKKTISQKESLLLSQYPPDHSLSSTLLLLDSIKSDENGNKLISSYSLDRALVLLAAGTADGTARQNIYEYLGLDGLLKNHTDDDSLNDALFTLISAREKQEDLSRLKSAYGVWFDKNINPSSDYIKTVKKRLDAEAASFDSSDSASLKKALKEINSFADKKTDHMIPTLFTELPSNSKAILINTLYFSDEWAQPYKETDVLNGYFTKTDGSHIKVPYMISEEDSYYLTETAAAFTKPYKNKTYEFIGIVPTDSQLYDYTVSDLNIENLLTEKNKINKQVNVTMPKFSFTYETWLKDTLCELGMESIFTDQTAFPNMAENPLTVNDIFQKSKITVEEKGTKAAAITAAVKGEGAAVSDVPYSIYLSRPFVFLIRNKETKEILFAGKVEEPVFEE